NEQFTPTFPQANARNHDQKCAERANNRGPRGQVPPVGEKESGDSPNQCNDPANQQTIAELLREINSANRRHDQVAEDQKHARNPDEARDDESEQGVKQEIPPANAQSFLVSTFAVE